MHVETSLDTPTNQKLFSGGYLGYAYAPLTAQQLSAAGLSAAAGLPAAYAAAAGPTTAAGQAQPQPQDTRIQWTTPGGGFATFTYDWIGNCATEYHEKKLCNDALQNIIYQCWCHSNQRPPWHKNIGHEHLLDARWDLSTNDLFQEYFTLSGYCHSLVLQVISQGCREKARIAIIVRCNGLTLNRIRSRR